MSDIKNLRLENTDIRRAENGFIVRSTWSERQTTLNGIGVSNQPSYNNQTERVFTDGGTMTAHLSKIWSENQ